MSAFYGRQNSFSRKSFDTSDRSLFQRSDDAIPNRPGSASGYHSNASATSLSLGGAPMQAMMVPGMVVPTVQRPDPTSPFSDWEAYIVKQTQDWSDKRAQSLASPTSTKGKPPRIVWADQIRNSPPQQSQPLTYTKARDHFAPPLSPQSPSPPKSSRYLARRPDLLRSHSAGSGRSNSPPSSSARPTISSPIMTQSVLTTAPTSSVGPTPAPIQSAPSTSYDAPFTRTLPEPLQVPQNESQMSSECSFSQSRLPLSSPSSDFSASLLIDLEKRSSLGSTSSGRAPGPSELIATSLPALLNSQNSGPPSIASTYSMHSRRASWASSLDLDPAVICTPPLSHESWQAQPHAERPAFLAEFGLDHDTEESDTECSHYDDDHEEGAMGLANIPRDDQDMPPQPIFQRLEADLLTHDDGYSQCFAPDGRPLAPLEIASLPREKEEIVRKARARLISPTSFRKAFSLKSKSSSGSRSTDSSPSLANSSSDEVGKISESAEHTSSAAAMTQWAAAVPLEASPTSPAELSTLSTSHAPFLELSPSIDSCLHATSPTASSAERPLSPTFSNTFSNSAGSVTSESSRGGMSSLNSSGERRHRVGTPGLTKAASSAAGDGAAATLDPTLARVQTRARSSGSVGSNTPSIALSASSSSSNRRRRPSRKSGRSRITEGMPSFADMARNLNVPASQQRRLSARSLSSEGSIDTHSNASSGSSYAKVAGSSDDGTSVASSAPVVKSVLRKRVPSEDSLLLSSRKEVTFDLPVSVEEARDEEEDEEILEHEQKQRSRLTLPPMKLQSKHAACDVDTPAADPASPKREITREELDIIHFLSSFGRDINTVESLEVLDNVHAGSSEWPKRQDWDSLPAYLAACATTFLSRFADDSATLVYSDERAPAQGAKQTVAAPILSSHPVYTSTVRSILRIANWEQPLVSGGVSAFYALSLLKGKLSLVLFVGLALLVATQATQSGSSSFSPDAEELSDAYSKIASVLLGSAETHERMRNLVLWRSPKASLRFTGVLLALAMGASHFGRSVLFSLPGLFVGLALFAWLPAILHQPEWAPTWLKQGNPVDVLLYDVPTDAQHAMLTLRRRAAGGEQLYHRPDSALEKLPSVSTTSFDHRVSAQELQHVSDVVEGAFFASHDKQAGHVVVLASRILFRTLVDKSAEPISFADELTRQRTGSASCRITFDARLEKVVRLSKTANGGLEVRLRNGQTVQFDQVEKRDEAFNRVLALAPQKWH